MKGKELLERVISGDQSAFKKLVRKYRHTVFLSALSILHDPDEAEEIVQEVFLKVHLHLSGLRDQNAFERWLRSVTCNLAINRLKRMVRREGCIPLDEVAPEDLLSPSADEELLRREMVEEVMRAMDELPEGEREILREYLLEDKGYRELSEKYGLSYHAVVMRVRRAREKVREKVLKRLSSIVILLWGKIGKTIGGVAMKVTTKVAVTGAVVVMLTGGGIWMSHRGEEKAIPKMSEVKVERLSNVRVPARVTIDNPKPKKKEDELTFEEFNKLLDEYFESGKESSATVSSEPVYDNEGGKSEIKGGEGKDEDREAVEEMSPELKLKVERYAELARILPYVRQLEDEKTRLFEEYHNYLKTHDWDGYDEYGRKVQDVAEQYDDEIMAVIERLRVYWAQIDAMFPELELWERYENEHGGLTESFRYGRLIEYFGRELPWDGNPDYFKAKPK